MRKVRPGKRTRWRGLPCCVLIFINIWILSGNGLIHAGEGTTGADFLHLIPGARSGAMAGAYSALGNDAETLFVNPAGMLDLLNPQIYFSHFSWWEEVNYDSIWGVQPLGRKGAVGLMASFLNIPPFNSTEDTAAESISAWDLVTAGGYAYQPHQSLGFGCLLKHLASRLGPARSWGLALDIGAKYYCFNNQMALAATMRNLGFINAFEESADALPLSAGLGAAYHFRPDEPWRISLAADLSLPLHDQITLAICAEAWVRKLLALRVGFKSASDTGDWLSMGAGLHWRRFHLDYALSPLGTLGTVHHFTFGYDFGTQLCLDPPKLKIEISVKQIVRPSGEIDYERNFVPCIQIPAGLKHWEIRISSRSGQLLKRIEGEDQIPYIITWDGRDEQGVVLDPEVYYTYRFVILDRRDYTATAQGEILPVSITKLPPLKAIPRDIFKGKFTLVPKKNEKIKEWSFSIFDADGKLVKKYQGLGPIPRDFGWDGTDQQNRQVSWQKNFRCVLRIKDLTGKVISSAAPITKIDVGTKAYLKKDLALRDQVLLNFDQLSEFTLKGWSLDFIDTESKKVIRTYSGEGNPPDTLSWDTCDESGRLLPNNRRYSYALSSQDHMGNVWQQASDLESTDVNVLGATSQEVKIKIEKILFDFNKAKIKPIMLDKIRKTADLVKAVSPDKARIFIEGHTDEIGNDRYNYELSLKRAQMVMRYLVEKGGVPSSIMEIKGYGKKVPLGTGKTSSLRALSRRVEITIILLK
ncbi:PorV/PorQ family protein [bacterium]|nr:PorV/PorQ family protein [bacterium]